VSCSFVLLFMQLQFATKSPMCFVCVCVSRCRCAIASQAEVNSNPPKVRKSVRHALTCFLSGHACVYTHTHEL
jgi:hypothetical protein